MKRKHLLAAMTLAALLSVSALPVSALWTPAAVKLNSAPVAENLELTTYRSVSVSGSFRALDPEGDPITFSLVKKPGKGTVETDGGDFVYTPADGKKGKDTFTYAATDDKGNVSNEATVTVDIKKQKTSVTYSDMTGSGDAYAATVLAEKGIFVGENIGGRYVFRPDEDVTRGEFLVMCMNAAGADLLDVTRTGFFDDDKIPLWQKPYAATALTEDVISGSVAPDGAIVFAADEPVTFAQASVMVNNALGITDVSLTGDARDLTAMSPGADAFPAWASQASANLSSCGIIGDFTRGVSASTVTRADAARILSAAMSVLDRREGDSLLGWAK